MLTALAGSGAGPPTSARGELPSAESAPSGVPGGRYIGRRAPHHADPAPIAVGEPNGTPPTCRNGLYLTAGRSISRFDEPAVRQLPVADLPTVVNALGYAVDQDLFYAMADYRDGSHLVTITAAGTLVDRGRAPLALRWSHAGAISANRWYLRSDGDLMVVGVDPDSPDYLRVQARQPLSAASPGDLPAGGLSLGDWDVNPLDGRLYGIATGTGGPGRLVSVDPATGTVSTVATPQGLPGDSSFGAVAVDPYGVLHALHNGTGRMFHLPLDNPGAARGDQVGPPIQHADAASCPPAWDFGDVSGDNSTRHSLTTFGVLAIGSAVDADPAEAPAAAGGDEDDGLPGPVEFDTDATSLSIPVAVRNTTGAPALLAGWHDLDGDGVHSVAERALVAVPSGATSAVLSWSNVTVSDRVGDTVPLRLRLYGSVPDDPQPTGRVSGGEVEDHLLRLRWPAPPPGPNRVPEPALPVAPSPRPDPEPSPQPSPSMPARSPVVAVLPYESPDRPSRRLPITLTFFAGVLVPAIVVAARGAVAGRAAGAARR